MAGDPSAGFAYGPIRVLLIGEQQVSASWQLHGGPFYCSAYLAKGLFYSLGTCKAPWAGLFKKTVLLVPKVEFNWL